MDIHAGNQVAVAHVIANWAAAHDLTADDLRHLGDSGRRIMSQLARGKAHREGYIPSDDTWYLVLRAMEAAAEVAKPDNIVSTWGPTPGDWGT